jgi:CheY-like chemotaxis protein
MPEVSLQGRRILIVEDDYFLADDMRAEFERAGAEVLGPVARVSHALELLKNSELPDGAVLDINLAGEMVYPVADALRAKHIPFIFATGYDAETIPAAYAGVTSCEKPIEPAKIGRLLSGR